MSENYTQEQEQEMIIRYRACESDEERREVVEELAHEMARTPASIRSKLVHLKVYQKPERTTKSGGPVIKKAELVEAIAERLGCNSETVESLEKATKVALTRILGALPVSAESDAE